MIQICGYKGCGVVYGQKEPLSDRSIDYGLCPDHIETCLREIKAEIEESRKKSLGFKVLIVEDSSLFRQLLKNALQDRFPFIEVYEAVDAREALQKAETLRPQLVFMDIRLPGESGLELTKKIKGQQPNTIVAILTGYDLPEYREASSQYADFYFSKGSATAENILKWVESILSTRG